MSTLRTNAVESITGTATDFPNSLSIQGKPVGSAATEPTSRFPYVVGSVAELASVPEGLRVDGFQVSVNGVYSGSRSGSGVFVWRSNIAKTEHDVGVYIDPIKMAEWDGTPLGIESVSSSDNTGSGCFERQTGQFGDYNTVVDVWFATSAWTPGVAAAISRAVNRNASSALFITENHDFSANLPAFDVPTSVISNGSVLACVKTQLSSIMRFNQSCLIENLVVDYAGNEASLSGIDVYSDYKIRNLTVKNMFGEVATNQYALRVKPVPGEHYIEGCKFSDISCLGDNITTNKGFAGGVFIIGEQIPAGSRMDVFINNSTFEGIRTEFLEGATYQQKLDDTDADAIRSFHDGVRDTDLFKREIVHCSGNVYRDCGKRIWKINEQTLFADNETVEGVVTDTTIPGMQEICQTSNGVFNLSNSDITASLRFGLLTQNNSSEKSTISNVNVKSILHANDAESKNYLVRANSGNVRVNIDGVRAENFQGITRKITEENELVEFRIINSDLKNFKSIIIAGMADCIDFVMFNVTAHLHVVNGTSAYERGIWLSGDTTDTSVVPAIRGLKIFESSRTAAVGESPRLLNISTSNFALESVDADGINEDLSIFRFSDSDNTVLTRCRAPNVTVFTSVNFTMIATIYKTLTQSGNSTFADSSPIVAPVGWRF